MGPRMAQTGTERPDHPSARERAGSGVDAADLRERETWLGELIDANPVPMAIERLSDHKLLFANQPLLDLYGMALGDCCVRPLQDRWSDPGLHAAILAEVEAGGEVRAREVQVRRDDRPPAPVAITARRMTYRGEPACLSTLIDLTELRAAEAEIARQREALFQTEKMASLGTLLAGVAHELNNPLSIVLGYAALLDETLPDGPNREAVAKISTAADRCARIVRTFLSMARARTPERRAVDLNALVAGAVDLAGYGLRSDGIRVELRLDPGLVPAWGDGDQLSQVVTNIVLNAQQAMQDAPPPRSLTLTSRTTPDGPVIEIRDTGPGIPEPLRGRVFDPFFTTKPQGKGTGIGLAVTRSIVEAHGGRIELVPVEGAGACFRVTFPAAEASVEAAAATPGPEGSGARLLVVDDEPDLLAMLAARLGAAGYRVVTAPGGRAALAELDRRPFDAVITDIRMPDMGGAALIGAILARHPDLAGRVLAMTGDALSHAGALPRAVTTIEKPIDFAALLVELRRIDPPRATAPAGAPA